MFIWSGCMLKDPIYIPEDSCETAATVFKNVFRSFLDDTIWSVGLKNHNHEQNVSKML